MADENSNLILKGLSKGDQIGGPTQLAKILCEIIKSCKSFDKDDLTNIDASKDPTILDCQSCVSS